VALAALARNPTSVYLAARRAPPYQALYRSLRTPMPTLPMPAAEVTVDVDLVRRLVGSQFPQWADLTVRPVEKAALGWDNWLFRLGDDLAARLPRRQLAADLVAKEQRWLPILAPTLPLPVPPTARARCPRPRLPVGVERVPMVAGRDGLHRDGAGRQLGQHRHRARQLYSRPTADGA
jgi:hypothetical protein